LAAEENDTERHDVIVHAVELLYGFKPRPEQVDCIKWLLYEKKDLILVAKTSFRKSLVMQVLPCLVPDSIIIVILPLLALGAEQEEKILRILGPFARPAFVYGNNVSYELLRDIQRREYTHILSSPELITGRRFRTVLISMPTSLDSLPLPRADALPRRSSY
jgi:superfamily II DNA helicase RecQ